MKRFVLFFFISLTPIIHNSFSATMQHTKVWSSNSVTGSLTPDKKFKYYLEPQIRLIDNHYKFEEFLFNAALGYQPFQDFVVFFGFGPHIVRRSSGDMLHENRIWQQAGWKTIFNDKIVFFTRTRLEERKDTAAKPWAIRLRQRFMFRFPFINSKFIGSKHALVLFDEMFFSLNHPQWINSNKFFSQNRLFVGIGRQLNPQSYFDVGYLNQIIWGNPKQVGHVLYFNLNLNFG